MKRLIQNLKTLGASFLFASLLPLTAQAQAPSQEPLFLVAPVKPIMMFNMSKDHQLFFKLYDDYSDITSPTGGDADGIVDTTYNNNFEYYGYFDSKKCYQYDPTDGRFEPNTTLAVNHYCQETTDTTPYWSGNFLNWATMTRMDAIRKILYGGYRSTDTNTETVLERAFLPNDAHSFAKWYGGADLRRLTPYDANLSAADARDRGLTLCNTSEVDDRDTYSQNATGANDRPVIRLARGNYSLWASNERWQCRFGVQSNGNVPASSGINAYADSPVATTLDKTVTITKSGQVRVGANSTQVNFVLDSGDDFNGLSAGGTISIGGTSYTINTVPSSTQLTVNTVIDPPLTGQVQTTSDSDRVKLVTGSFDGLAVNDVISINSIARTILAINAPDEITVNHTYPLAVGNVTVTGSSNQVVRSSGSDFSLLNTGDTININSEPRTVTGKINSNTITVDHVYPRTNVSGTVRITSNSNQINFQSGTNFANLVVGDTITIDGQTRTVTGWNTNNQIVVDITYPTISSQVNVAANSTIVNWVSGTQFTGFAVGDRIRINGSNRTVAGINSATQLVINTPFASAQTNRTLTVTSKENRSYSANVNAQTTYSHSYIYQQTLDFTATRSTRVASYTASYNTIVPENTELIARVLVDCTSSTTDYKCRRYVPTSGTYAGQNIDKPVGLLQEYANKVNFGLMTGSYRKSKSGGVLRKAVGPIDVKDSLGDTNTDEIGDDGIFKVPSTSENSIIRTLDLLRIYGYNFTTTGGGDSQGTYLDSRASGGDNCRWGWSSFSDEPLTGAGTGQCSNWGNPQAEIFLESLRYLAGKEASNFAVDDSTFIAGLNNVDDWDDPIIDGASGNKCAALNILQFNASTTSYDNDNLDVGIADISFDEAGVRTATSNIGALEGVNSQGASPTQYFVGRNGETPDPDTHQLCTPKSINSGTGGLGAADGICSEAPRLEGGYNIAGLAYLARKNGIGSDREKVKTHGVVLAPAIPSITIPVPNDAGTGPHESKKITILPACRNSDLADDANCAIVDFKVVSGPTLNTTNQRYEGSLYVNWEDSEQGGDYDQDMWGVISYSISKDTVSVTTDVMAESTIYDMGFGYVISGTLQDGFHVHSGIEGFTRADPRTSLASTVNGCNNCQVGDGPTTQVYDVGSSLAEQLKNPLWYAAKWGGYTKTGLTDTEIAATNPESQTADNIRTYFYATNPSSLEAALAKLFETIAGSVGSASTVAANSTSSQGDTHIYQARFDSQDWSGQVLDFALTSTGVSNTANWNTHNTMARSSGFVSTRNVYTYDGTTPTVVKLTNTNINLIDPTVLNNQVPNLTASLKLNTDADYSLAVRRIKWLLGDDTDEKNLTFRVRTHLLGDIINSDPGYAGAASQRHNSLPSGTAFGASTYTGYVATKKDRRKLVFVGANDGMLHAFDAANGNEVFAYIPRGVYKKLATLSDINYSHQYFVDGPVYVSDYYRESDDTWRTVVAGTLGSGGRGVYALDVTDILNSTTETEPDVIFDISDDDTTTAQPNATLKNDIGYSGSKVLVLPVNAPAVDGGGRWMAFFSNGTGSVNGGAKLIGIDINDPTKFVSIDTGTTGNGLSPAAFLSGAQNVITAAYAGDVTGKLWKFDLSNADYTQWGSAYKSAGVAVPLINLVGPSGSPQPITSEPTLGLNSLKLVSGVPSVMVYVGTGQYSYTTDLTDTSIQSIYAIADTGSAITIDATSRSTLLHEKWVSVEASGERTVLNDIETTDTPAVAPAVDWSTKNGWFIDLIVKSGSTKDLGTPYGERVLNKPLLLSDRVILNTFTPSTNQCDYGGSGWLMELVGVGDKYVGHSVLGDEANTQLNRPIISDLVPLRAADSITIIGSNLGGKKEENLAINSTITTIEGAPGDDARGRMSWRQIK